MILAGFAALVAAIPAFGLASDVPAVRRIAVVLIQISAGFVVAGMGGAFLSRRHGWTAAG
jgi:hypothetical protein